MSNVSQKIKNTGEILSIFEEFSDKWSTDEVKETLWELLILAQRVEPEVNCTDHAQWTDLVHDVQTLLAKCTSIQLDIDTECKQSTKTSGHEKV